MSKTFFRGNPDVFQGKMTRLTAKRPAVRVRWELEEYTLNHPRPSPSAPQASGAFPHTVEQGFKIMGEPGSFSPASGPAVVPSASGPAQLFRKFLPASSAPAQS